MCEVTYGGVQYKDALKMPFDRFTDLVHKVDEVSKRGQSKMSEYSHG